LIEQLSAYSPVIWLVLLTAGLVIGLLAGLLGVGGGVVAVPVLMEVFDAMGVAPGLAVAIAIGTAQANILLVSLTAALAHWRAGTVDRDLVRTWLPALLLGTVAGLAASAVAPPRLLTATFALAALALALKMIVGDRLVLGRSMPTGMLAQVPPALVGALASSVGVGSGTLSTPVLSLFSFPVRRAVGAGALFNLAVALPATGFFLAHDQGVAGRPLDTFGDVAVICLLALSLPAVVVTPLSARLSTRVPVVLLRRLFAACLALVAFRLLLRL
jgi:uncharacterized membrane protein YfcA